jgi:hypothetical protein
VSLSPSGPHVAIIFYFHFSFTTSLLATGMTAGIAAPPPGVSAERIPRPTPAIPGGFSA